MSLHCGFFCLWILRALKSHFGWAVLLTLTWLCCPVGNGSQLTALDTHSTSRRLQAVQGFSANTVLFVLLHGSYPTKYQIWAAFRPALRLSLQAIFSSHYSLAPFRSSCLILDLWGCLFIFCWSFLNSFCPSLLSRTLWALAFLWFSLPSSDHFSSSCLLFVHWFIRLPWSHSLYILCPLLLYIWNQESVPFFKEVWI